MNCEQAKEIQIVDFLNNLGYKAARVYGVHVYFNAPYRKDKNPSFKVNSRKNRWYDLGTGDGGNILDLVMLINSTNISGALLILQKPELSKTSFSFSEKQKSTGIEIKHVQPLQNRALVQYVESRGIPAKIASLYLMEAYYNTYLEQKNAFFALAFKNDKGGYELRNGHKTEKYPSGYKVKTSPNYITTISGNSNIINVFEGFMDFLSAMVFFKTTKPAYKTIVLNTTNNLIYIEPLIKSAKKINLYLDNDESGFKARDIAIGLNPNAIDHSSIMYPNFNDFNQFLNSNDYENKRK